MSAGAYQHTVFIYFRTYVDNSSTLRDRTNARSWFFTLVGLASARTSSLDLVEYGPCTGVFDKL